MHLWDGAVKEEKFPHTRKTLHWRRWRGGWLGSFGATEENTERRAEVTWVKAEHWRRSKV